MDAGAWQKTRAASLACSEGWVTALPSPGTACSQVTRAGTSLPQAECLLVRVNGFAVPFFIFILNPVRVQCASQPQVQKCINHSAQEYKFLTNFR